MTGTIDNAPCALAQADLLLLLCRFLNPVEAGDRTRFLIGDADLADLLKVAGLDEDPRLAEALRLALQEAAAIDADAWDAEFTRLFEGATACPINETAYIRRDKGVLLADLRGFYRAFGFEPAPGRGEKPDHMVTELQYLALLLTMLWQARNDGLHEQIDITHKALASYVQDHPGDWLPLFYTRLATVAQQPCFAHLARALELAWRGLCRLHGWPAPVAPPAVGPLEGIIDEGSPYECEMAPDEPPGAVDLRINGRSV